MRGTRGTAELSPDALFDKNRDAQELRQTEVASIRTVVSAFGAARLPGKLFLNVAPEVLRVDVFPRARIEETLRDAGLAAERVVLEVTENQPSLGDARIYRALKEAKSMGFEVAIDDLGEGYASLRVWAELQPDYVKIDKHFVHGLHSDPVKFQFVRTIRQLSQAVGTRVIAEGVEVESELRVLRDLGVEFAQGYFIAEPGTEAPTRLAPHLVKLLRSGAPDLGLSLAVSPALLDHVVDRLDPLDPATPANLIRVRFAGEMHAQALAVVVDGLPLGLVRRGNAALASAPDGMPASELMEPSPLTLDSHLNLHEVGVLLSQGDPRQFGATFVVTERSRYRGVCDAQRVMRGLTEYHAQAERYANPLTSLPGNVPLQRTLSELLERRFEFIACLCDIDNLKSYNSVFGYARGDNLIKYTAILLEAYCDPRVDFVAQPLGGHFVLLLRSADWEERVAGAVQQFRTGRAAFLAAEDVAREGFFQKDRRGTPVLQPLPTLSIGAVKVVPGLFKSHHEVLEAAHVAAQQAKKSSDGALFIERRRPESTHRESLN